MKRPKYFEIILPSFVKPFNT